MRTLTILLLLTSTLSAQATITADLVFTQVGEVSAVSFTMDSAATSAYGWSFGACHDPGLTLLTAVSPVDVLTAFYVDVNIFTFGFMHGAVWDLTGAPYPGGVLVDATYSGEGSIFFCDQVLGLPEVENLISDETGTEILTTWIDGGVTELHDSYIRGDCVDSGTINITDAVGILDWALLGNPGGCADACDSNADGAMDVSDAVYLLTYLFDLGVAPPAPFPACGTVVALGCAVSICP